MTQGEKPLLIKDLCARLPYGVKFHFYPGKDDKGKETIDTAISYDGDYQCVETNIEGFNVKNIKLYLRPMSSMTEEERKELSIILNYEFYVDDDFALVAEDDRHRIRIDLMEKYIDWLIAHHFDYRGLIPMGLALEAPEGMYKTE